MRATVPAPLVEKVVEIHRLIVAAGETSLRIDEAVRAGSVSICKAELDTLADITNRVMVHASIAGRAAAKHLNRNPLSGVRK
jgi:hypothetical protein